MYADTKFTIIEPSYLLSTWIEQCKLCSAHQQKLSFRDKKKTKKLKMQCLQKKLCKFWEQFYMTIVTIFKKETNKIREGTFNNGMSVAVSLWRQHLWQDHLPTPPPCRCCAPLTSTPCPSWARGWRTPPWPRGWRRPPCPGRWLMDRRSWGFLTLLPAGQEGSQGAGLDGGHQGYSTPASGKLPLVQIEHTGLGHTVRS